MIPLPPTEATDDEVRAWVRMACIALEQTPRVRNWKFKALGMSTGEALADAPRDGRIGFAVPVGEMRILRVLAKERGIGVEPLVRRGFATWMCAVGDVDPEDVPSLGRGGMLYR